MGASELTHYDIEMLWACSLCRHRGNRGLKDRYCCNCGHKKDDTDREYMPNDMTEAAALSGDDALRAGAGRDWVCKYCESVQNQLSKCCGNCGGERDGTRLVSPAQAEVIGVQVREDFREAVRETEARGLALDAIADADDTPPPKAWRLYALFAAVLVLSGALLWWLFAPRDVVTQVSATHWRHDTVIERYAIYSHEGWYPEPRALQVVPLGMRHHHYDRVHVGSHQESYQDRYACGETCTTNPSYTTCSSNGNGTARCTKHGGGQSCSTKYCTRTAYRTVQDYQDVSRSQMWFGWRSWGWGYNRTVTRQGSTNPAWPTADDLKPQSIGSGESERGARRSSYKITFREDDGDTHDIEPKTEAEFLKYPRGSTVKLRVNNAGSVEVLP